MDIIQRSIYAMNHFMINNPELTPRGYRDYFTIRPFPYPSATHNQWDDGDGTSRALDAWIYLRKITGDVYTGREVEEGQWKYLKSLIDPRNGLIFVGDHSNIAASRAYYHLWDQGRTLRHLINRYQFIVANESEKYAIEALIVKMIEGVNRLSSCAKLENGRAARYWVYDAYWNDMPIPGGMEFGPYNFMNFTMGNAQLLEPAVQWAAITSDHTVLEWAMQLAEGFIAGLETRRESTSPMFGDNGQFNGHFHCVVSGLTGTVHLAKELCSIGNISDCHRFLDITIKAYRWIFSEDNLNRGGSHGWFPENSGKETSPTSEICCTADMIEFAAALASMAFIVPGYDYLDDLWDDVDRFALNELFSMQVLKAEHLRSYVNLRDIDKFDEVAKLYDGGWPFGHNWPHDLMGFKLMNRQVGDQADKSSLNNCACEMNIGGCCLYSGPRGFYGYWNAMIKEAGDTIEIRFSGRYRSAAIDINTIQDGGFSYTLNKPRKILARIPKTADASSIRVLCCGKEVPFVYEKTMMRIIIDSVENIQYQIFWQDISWTSIETLGMENNGHIKGCPIGSRVTFRLEYQGNKLVRISPSEYAYLPLIDGL